MPVPSRQQFRKPKTAKRVLVIRLCLAVLARIMPPLAGLWAYRLWFSTQRYKLPVREIQWRKTAVTITLPDPHGSLMVYKWGKQVSANHRVLLLHGWNGRATQMAAFAEPLQTAGFQVVAFDAPGHGQTPGKQSNIFRIVNAITTVVNELGPFDFVIAHSFGAMALARALKEGLVINKAVSISCPSTGTFLIDQFCLALQLPHAARKNLLQRIDKRFGKDIWTRISTRSNAQRLTTPALIVHDENDTAVSVSHSKILFDVWPHSELFITHGLGHSRILRDTSTIQSIVNYLSTQSL